MAGTELNNMAGTGPVTRTVDTNSTVRGVANDPIGRDEARAMDSGNAELAKSYQQLYGDSAAAEINAQIIDQNLRIKSYIELYGAMGDQSAPKSLFEDGSGGISKPDSLFFMLAFYLESGDTKFKWSDVLNAADIRSTSSFIQSKVNDSFLPLQDSSQSSITPVVANASTVTSTANQLKRDQKQRVDDLKKGQIPTTTTGGKNGVNNIVKWPIQNLPIITGGLNKSVDWKGTEQTTTFAEPLLNINGGGSAVDITLEFIYAVGLPGIGDNIPMESAASSDQGNSCNTETTSDLAYWTVEDLMGVCYLAQSLVLPWESSKIIGSKGEVASAGAPYFPVLFLRHHSLFPYLAPFVVVSAKIEPDEGQPLMVTHKNRANRANLDSLDYSAIRQTVKITLGLRSANYYTTVFQGEEVGQEVQRLTSGKTYRELAGQLLGGRI